MPGSITPLPIMLEEEDRKIYENLQPPKSIVVRYGYQKLVAELPYDGDAKPGCGSKLVIRTGRGVEMGEMLTSTCPNAGCSKSVSRREMLEYIENSGGKDFPFTSQGKVLRVAAMEDVNEQARLDAGKPRIIQHAKSLIRELDLPMHLVEIERLLGGERIIFYYTAEQWVDFRELVKRLAGEYQTRIEMHQVSAREEARLVADYEKCGQHCCCKQFLKVLKPVSMRSAKIQKATLDPTKISGRCGRLMCCLRYEDETYDDLRKRLPRRKSLVETEDGMGMVLDTQILTQLVLVQIGRDKPAAYALENLRVLSDKEAAAWRKANPPGSAPGDAPGSSEPRRVAAGPPGSSGSSGAAPGPGSAPANTGRSRTGTPSGQTAAPGASPSRGYHSSREPAKCSDSAGPEATSRNASDVGGGDAPQTPEAAPGSAGAEPGRNGAADGDKPKSRRRRRRRRGRGGNS